MDTPLVSIIIPVFKVEQFIRNCIISIKEQSFKNWEMILIDDGSPDNSGIICDEYAAKDNRIRVIHQVNQGVAVARNQGLDLSRGKWIWFVDGDDYVVSDALQKLSDIINKISCDTILFGLIHDNNGVISKDGEKRSNIFHDSKEVFLQRVQCYANPSMLFLRSIIEQNNIRFTEGIKMAEDLEFQYKYLLFCKTPIQIEDSLYVYQHREGSAMTNSLTEYNNMYDCLKVANNLFAFVNDLGIEEEIWFSIRIRLLIKGCLQSAETLPYKKVSNLNKEIKLIIERFKGRGYTHIVDSTIKLSLFNLRFYFLLLRVYYKMKGKR